MAAPLPPEDILAQLGVSAPVFAAESGTALVWKVRRGAGFAALKLYKSGHMGNEAAGFRYLAALNGQGAARVYHAEGGTALTEWLEGPPLADRRQDAAVIAGLAATARQLHRAAPQAGTGFTPLEDFLASLFQFEPPAAWDAGACAGFAACQHLAEQLLDTQSARAVLHGDLHPGNVICTPAGLRAFDAKGIRGEPAYELANAFRHPRGRPDLLLNPERIRHASIVWSGALGCHPVRLLQWAAAKAALSMAWRAEQGLDTDLDARLILRLLAALDVSGNARPRP